MKRKDLLVLILLIICIISILIVRYYYDQGTINSTTALALNDILGFLFTVVVLYHIFLYIEKKRKLNCIDNYIWVLKNIL